MSSGSDPLAGTRPLHSRSFDVEVRAAGDGLWQAQGELVDLRKGGFVPIAGDLQAAGLLHHMRVSARFDARARTLLEISAEQPAVAFEASALSGGESCRDPVERLRGLAGVELAPDWERHLGDACGGPRGCAHVLALTRLLGASLAWLLDRDAAAGAEGWRPGERIFHRSLCLDGAEQGDGALGVELQLTDLHCAPAAERVRPLERLARQDEVRGRAVLGRRDLVLRELRLARRVRGVAELEAATWCDEGAGLRELIGTPLARGWRRRLREHLPDQPPGAPLAAALLDLAPAVLQCLSSDCDHWPVLAAADSSLVVAGGLPDSCFMWRADGPLARALARERRGEGDADEPS